MNKIMFETSEYNINAVTVFCIELNLTSQMRQHKTPSATSSAAFMNLRYNKKLLIFTKLIFCKSSVC